MCVQVLNEKDMETIKEKKYPAGTTKEQWDQYEIDLQAHKERCLREKPREPQWSDYKEVRRINEHIYEYNFRMKMEDYKKALSEWQMMCSCDAPNEPGYYRANND